MSEQRKIWMVRIGDHVCGPYETAAIETLITEQRLSEIDEIALPCKGWNYVRDRGEFLGILERLKSSSFAGKQGSGSLTATSISRTENLSSLDGEEKTEELTFSKMQDTKTSPIVDFGDVSSTPPKASVVVERKAEKKKTGLVVALGLIVVVGLAALFKPQELSYNPLNLLSTEGRKRFGVFWSSGNFDESFKLLQSDKGLLDEHRGKYAALLLMRGNEFNSAERALELMTEKTSDEWKNLKGLAEQYRGKSDLAESYYLSVLKANSGFIPSLMNLGLLKREEGDWSLARSYFESAFSKLNGLGYDDVSFYLLESWMRQSLAETGVSKMDSINAYLQNQLVGYSTYIHEFKLIELWLSVTRVRWAKKEADMLKDFLDLDPQILISRKVSPYTYKLPEGALAYLCQDLDIKLKATRYKEAAMALCHIIDKKYDTAISRLKNLKQDEYAVALYSFAARLKKDLITADEQLVRALEFKKNEAFTKFFMQARFCYDKGDMKCAAEYWMKGIERDSKAYTGYAGLGASYLQVKDYDKARKFMQRAEGFAKSYGPLIELQTLMKDVKQ